jgi:clan AA aspartic protease
MIVGHVNASFEIVVQVDVLDAAGQAHGIEAILDTGFNGALTLPGSIIGKLGLILRTQSTAELADGSVQRFDAFAAIIQWDGHPRGILVQSIDAGPLLGMALIVGHELKVRVVDGGRVEIEAIP